MGINHSGLNLKPLSKAAAMAIKTPFCQENPPVEGSSMSLVSIMVTAAISATELTFTASRNAPIRGEERSLHSTLASKRTKKKEGRKIPAEATIAPGRPRTSSQPGGLRM